MPEKKSHPRGRPLKPRFLKEPHHRRATDKSLAAKQPQASHVIRLKIERVKKGGEDKGLGRHLSPADQLRRASCSPDLDLAHSLLLFLVAGSHGLRGRYTDRESS
jgi:hypothetical protein